MRLPLFVLMASLTLAILCQSTFARPTEIRVDRLVSGSWVQVGSNHTNGSSFTISDSAGDTYQVYCVPRGASDGAIGTVTITSSGTYAPTLFIGEPSSPYAPSEDARLPYAGAVDLAGIAWSGGKPSLQVFVTGNITNDLHAYHIVRIDALGNIQGKVSHEPSSTSPPALGRIYANAITDTVSDISAAYGDIHIVEAIGGDILAAISAPNGSITVRVEAYGTIKGNITAPNGSIGDILAGSDIRAGSGSPYSPVTIRAKSGIGIIRAGYDIYANITANYNSGSGAIATIKNTYTGTLKGTVMASTLGTDLSQNFGIYNFSGDVDADITLTGDLDGDGTYANSIYCPNATFHSGRTLSIGGSLGSTASIWFYDSGISGQIIINANNASETWSGSVTVGNASPFSLDGPNYTYTSAGIGGGAVGQAPFNFHAVDCLPVHNSTSTITTLPSNVTVRHYGPVFWAGSGSPVTIYARPNTSGPYVDYTSDFTVTAVTGHNHRDIQIAQKSGATLGWAAGYNYKIVPITNLADSNALRCLDVTGKPAVAVYEYKFTVTP